MKALPSIIGIANIKSNYDILTLGVILSEKLFSGIPFVGLDESVYEEIPAIYLEKSFLCLDVFLSGYPEKVDDSGYHLEVKIKFKGLGEVDSRIGRYANEYLKMILINNIDDKNIKIVAVEYEES